MAKFQTQKSRTSIPVKILTCALWAPKVVYNYLANKFQMFSSSSKVFTSETFLYLNLLKESRIQVLFLQTHEVVYFLVDIVVLLNGFLSIFYYYYYIYFAPKRIFSGDSLVWSVCQIPCSPFIISFKSCPFINSFMYSTNLVTPPTTFA